MKIWLKSNKTIIFILIVLVLIAYANSLNNAFLSDDIPAIVQNPNLENLGYVFSHGIGFLRPLLYWAVYKIGGLNAHYFRLINITFHLLSTILLFAIITKLHSKKVGLIASAIFSIHPVLVEPVVWISGGAYVQATFFALLTILTYLHSYKKPLIFITCAITYFLAVGSHIIASSIPPFLFFYELQHKRVSNRLFYIIILGAIALIPLLSSFISLKERASTLQTVHYQQEGFNNPHLVIPIALTNYLQLIFFPKDLTLYHSELSVPMSVYILMWFVVLILLLVTIYSFFKAKSYFLWLSFFLISLLPTMVPAFFAMVWIVAERYIYLASIGIFVPVALLFEKLEAKKSIKPLIYPALVLILVLMAARTIIRNNDWHSEDNLWAATAKTSPSSPNTHNNMGDVYARHGDLDEAAKEFQKAIEIKPNYADAYHNLANVYQEMEKIDLAIQSYQKAISFNPNLWQSNQNLAAIYYQQEKFDDALKHIQKAISIDPKNLNLQVNLAIIYTKMGEVQKAREVLESILKMYPNDPKVNALLQAINESFP